MPNITINITEREKAIIDHFASKAERSPSELVANWLAGWLNTLEPQMIVDDVEKEWRKLNTTDKIEVLNILKSRKESIREAEF